MDLQATLCWLVNVWEVGMLLMKCYYHNWKFSCLELSSSPSAVLWGCIVCIVCHPRAHLIVTRVPNHLLIVHKSPPRLKIIIIHPTMDGGEAVIELKDVSLHSSSVQVVW